MTTFTGTLTATDGSGQTATASVNVAQTPPPTALTVTNVVAPASAAPGTMRTITATAHGGTAPHTFSITPIGGIVPTSTGPNTWTITPQGTAAATLTGMITARDSAGQTATSAVSFSQTATIPPPTTGQATFRITGVSWMATQPALQALIPQNTPFSADFTIDLGAHTDSGDPQNCTYMTGFVSGHGTIGNYTCTMGTGPFILGLQPPGTFTAPACDLCWAYVFNNCTSTVPVPNCIVQSIHWQMRRDDATALLSPKGNITINIPRITNRSVWSPETPLCKFTLIFTNNGGESINLISAIQQVA